MPVDGTSAWCTKTSKPSLHPAHMQCHYCSCFSSYLFPKLGSVKILALILLHWLLLILARLPDVQKVVHVFATHVPLVLFSTLET